MSETPRIAVEDILEAVAAHFGVTPAAIRSSRRDGLLSRARHIVCWFAGRLTDRTNVAVGRVLRCDHATVLYGRRQIDELRADPAVVDLLEGIEAAIDAVATLRARRAIPPPRHIDPFESAHRVVDDGERAAGLLSIAEIYAICEALEARADEHEDYLEQERLRAASREVAEAKREADAALYTRLESAARTRLERALKDLSKLFSKDMESAHG